MYFLVLKSVIGRKEPLFSQLGDGLKQDVWHTTDFWQEEEIKESSPESHLLFIYSKRSFESLGKRTITIM